jgi:hypothetical protein
MSRSRRKTPIFGHAKAKSDAEWKAQSARKLRRKVKQHLESTLDGDGFAGKRFDVVNPWSSEKDGKFYWVKVPSKYMRK